MNERTSKTVLWGDTILALAIFIIIVCLLIGILYLFTWGVATLVFKAILFAGLHVSYLDVLVGVIIAEIAFFIYLNWPEEPRPL